MQFRWKSVLILLAFVLPASAAGTYVSMIARQQYEAAQEAKRTGAVRTAMRYVGSAVVQYAAAHKNHLPDANRWELELAPYLPAGFDFTLPAPHGTRTRRIAINPRCAGKPITDDSLILFFESVSSERNAHDDLQSLPKAKDGSPHYTLQYVGGWEYDYPVWYCDSARSDPGWVKRNQGSF